MVDRELQLRQSLMTCAYSFAQMSRCERKKVGAVIHKDNRIISYGWNGSTAGEDNCCENIERMKLDYSIRITTWEQDYPLEDNLGRYRLVTKPEVVHAEMNAILKYIKGGRKMRC